MKKLIGIGVMLVLLSHGAWAKDIKIAVVGPMSMFVGEGQWNGATLAVEEINKAGGVEIKGKKHQLKLVSIDSNELLSIPDATNAMERAISREKADFILGGFRSEAALAMQEIAMDYQKIFLGVGASHKELTDRVGRDYERYQYFFRVVPFDHETLGKLNFMQLGFVAKQLAQEIGVSKLKVAVLAEKALWTKKLVTAAKQVLPKKMGMEVVGVWQPSGNATDVTAELTAIKRSGAHIIFTALSGPVGVVYTKTWNELKIPAVSVGINAAAQVDSFSKATGGKADYEATLNIFSKVPISEVTLPFFEKYKARFGEYPNYSAATYDAIRFLADAVQRAGTFEDTQEVIKALEQIKMPSIASPMFTFTKNHDVTFGAGAMTSVGIQWQNSQQQTIWPVKGSLPGFEGYEGVVAYQIPPWVMNHYKAQQAAK